ncbi:MAG: helix-turn-helix domain-containing protein [Candidatus Limivivens sp.]|nr:helix-turn-helix domain-containing protein [Candidatus Limivivens sp.]
MADIYSRMRILTGVDLFEWREGEEERISEEKGIFPDNPLLSCPKLRQELMERAGRQEPPVLYRDSQGVYFGCQKNSAEGEEYLFWGPMCPTELSYVEIHRFYKRYQIAAAQERHPSRLSFERILALTAAVSLLDPGQAWSDSELIKANGLTPADLKNLEREKTSRVIQDTYEEFSHHTYLEEQRTLACVRDGKLQEVEEYMDRLSQAAGKLSSTAFNHNKNLAICAITLATRAAIEGGAAPAEAYRVSDIYINILDRCTELSEILECRKKSMYELTKMAAGAREERIRSSYVEQCRDYIHKNYFRKMHLSEIARAIGISESYLSRSFAREEKMTIQEYIRKVRVERAENLLKYSEASLSEISDYVGFSSQSHFGESFREQKGMTPGQYRERYKRTVFSSRETKGH